MRLLSRLILKQEKLLLTLAGAAVLTLILMGLEFNLLEANLYDFRMTFGPPIAADPGIVLIAVDDRTVQTLDQISPLPIGEHVRLLEKLEVKKPRAIGYLIDLNRTEPSASDSHLKTQEQQFIDTARRMQKAGRPVLLGTPFDVTGEVLPPAPFSELPHSIAVIHKDGNLFAEDKITRRALTYLYDRPTFHIELARRLGLVSENWQPKGSYNVPEIDGKYFQFRYHGNTELGKSPPYKMYSFVDVLKDQIPDHALEDKVVLVGTLNRQDSQDFVFTPYAKNPFTNPKLIVHANILDSIIHDQGLVVPPKALNWAITFSSIACVFAWVLTSTPLSGLLATLTLAAGFTLLSHMIFGFQGYWIREAQPLIGIFLAYYLIVPYRLIREYKKRFDYQRKNELLMQVEELKTNFLSLVTHDLKTPVARIQGLSEVLLRKAGDRLNERDQKTVHNILAATDELNRFISSLLELSKLESNRLQIHFEYKDINPLIEKAVDAFKAQARARRIRLTHRLEPLFPIQVDPTLISKVLNNLIDNAIKYSPEDSDVLIESREVGVWTEVSVTDQGVGMSPIEQEQLFRRFFRAKNDATAQVNGTGLGLYLSKYFVEAHRGKVEVTSRPGKGTSFRIFLPIHNLAPIKETS